MRPFQLVLLILLFPASILAQGSDTLRRYEGDEILIEEERTSELVIKGVPVERASVSDLQALSGATRINDLILNLSPSLSPRKYGGLGGISLLSYRGLPPEYTVVFRDGVRISNEQHGLVDFARITSATVDEIEMLPSTSSILLGGDIIGAAINLRSREITGNRFSLGSAAVSYGGEDIGEQEHSLVLASQLSDGWGMSLSGVRQYSQGDYPFVHPISGRDLHRENNDAQLHDLLLTVQHRSETVPLTFRANHVRAKRGAPGATTIPTRGASALLARQNDEDILLSLSSTLTSFGWQIHPTIAYQNQYEEYIDPQTHLDDRHENTMIVANVRAINRPSEQSEIYLGVSVESDLLTSTQVAQELIPAFGRMRTSAYSAASLTLWDDVLLTGAVRGEYYSDVDILEVLPQVNLRYSLLKGLAVHAAFGLSYHAPTLNQLHWQRLGNDSLQPERSADFELGLSFEYGPEKGVSIALRTNFFHIRTRNQILWLQSGSQLFRPLNVLNSRTMGGELTGEITLPLNEDTKLTVSTGYTVLDAENLTENSDFYGKRLPHTARTQSQFQLLATDRTFGSIGMTTRYRGTKYSDLGNLYESHVPPVTTFDASYTLSSIRLIESLSVDLQLSVQNLTNAQYFELYNYPLPGRSIRLSTSISYQQTTKP